MAADPAVKYTRVVLELIKQGYRSKPITEKKVKAAFRVVGITKETTIKSHLRNMMEMDLIEWHADTQRFFLGPSTRSIDTSIDKGGIGPSPSLGNDANLPPVYKAPIRKRLLDAMREHPEKRHYSAWAARIGEDPKSVNKVLKRMLLEKSPPIVDESSGYYRIAYGLEDLANLENEVRVGLHGLKLEARIIDGLSTPIDKKNGGLSFLTPKQVREYRKRKTFNDFNFKGYPVTVTLHDCGLVEVFLKSSNNPITFEEFREFTFYLQGRFADVVEWKDWTVVQWGINADYNNLQLDGVKSVKLQVFRDAWFQIYQKREDVVRVECHSTKSIRADDIYKLFRSLTDCANGTSDQLPNEVQPYVVTAQPPSKWDQDFSYG